MFIVLIILLIDLVIFKRLNTKFIQTYHEYEGKYLWSLLFFPIVFFINIILFDVVTLLASFSFTLMALYPESDTPIMLFRILRNWSIVFFFLCGAGVYLIFKSRSILNNILFNWEIHKEKEALKQISIILGIGITLPFLYFIAIYLSVSNNQLLWWYLSSIWGENLIDGAALYGLMVFIFNVAIGGVIWYCSKKKLNSLSEEVGLRENTQNNETFIHTPISEETYLPSNAINKLKDLKQLLDDDVISEEEFNEMKKGILAKGL